MFRRFWRRVTGWTIWCAHEWKYDRTPPFGTSYPHYYIYRCPKCKREREFKTKYADKPMGDWG